TTAQTNPAPLADPTVPGLRYTERLTGWITIGSEHSDLELVLHISADDVEKLLIDSWHSARIVGTAQTPNLPSDRTRWTIAQSWLHVLIEDPRQVDTTLMVYRLNLTSPSGKRLYLRGHKTINFQNLRKGMWKGISSFSFVVQQQEEKDEAEAFS